ncbi:hypothetical protein Celaphus_00013442, partial [Cervus elaphus hippelaphus]
MRKTRSEKHMLNNFLKEHAYRLNLTSSPGSNITTHPLRNIKDPSTGAHLEVPGDRNTGKQGPHSEENTLSSSTFGLCTGPGKYQVTAWSNRLRSNEDTAQPQFFTEHLMARHPSPVLAPFHVSIGDLVITDQEFGLSMAQSGFEGMPFDGVLGLNYPKFSFTGGIPIFDNLKNQGAISEPVFAFYLSNREGGSSGDTQSDLDAHFFPLSLSISMNRRVISCSGGCEALVDTGTSLIQGPRRLVNNILRLIGTIPRGSKHYVSCFAVNTLPSIIFTINGFNYPLPAQAYTIKESLGCCWEEGALCRPCHTIADALSLVAGPVPPTKPTT